MLRQSFYDLYLYIDLLIHTLVNLLTLSELVIKIEQLSCLLLLYTLLISKLVNTFFSYIYKVFLHQNINPRSVAMAIVWVLLDCSILYELICHRQKEEESDYTLLVKVLKNTIEDEFMDEVLSRFTYEVYYDLYFEPNILSPIGKMQSQQKDFPSI